MLISNLFVLLFDFFHEVLLSVLINQRWALCKQIIKLQIDKKKATKHNTKCKSTIKLPYHHNTLGSVENMDSRLRVTRSDLHSRVRPGLKKKTRNTKCLSKCREVIQNYTSSSNWILNFQPVTHRIFYMPIKAIGENHLGCPVYGLRQKMPSYSLRSKLLSLKLPRVSPSFSSYKEKLPGSCCSSNKQWYFETLSLHLSGDVNHFVQWRSN